MPAVPRNRSPVVQTGGVNSCSLRLDDQNPVFCILGEGSEVRLGVVHGLQYAVEIACEGADRIVELGRSE